MHATCRIRRSAPVRACERRAGYGRLVCPACAQHTCCVQRSGRLTPAGAGLPLSHPKRLGAAHLRGDAGEALQVPAHAPRGSSVRLAPTRQSNIGAHPFPKAAPTTGRPPHGQRPAFPAYRTHSWRLRPAAAAAGRCVHLARGRTARCNRCRGWLHPVRPSHAARQGARTLAGPNIYAAALGGAGSRALVCSVGAARSVAAHGGAVAQSPRGQADPPARPPPTLTAPRQSVAPIGSGHILAGRLAGPPPSKDGRRGVNSTDPPRRPCCAAAPIRGTTPRPPAARWPATRLRRFPHGTRPAPGPRRPPPSGHTATVTQHFGTAADWEMQTGF